MLTRDHTPQGVRRVDAKRSSAARVLPQGGYAKPHTPTPFRSGWGRRPAPRGGAVCGVTVCGGVARRGGAWRLYGWSRAWGLRGMRVGGFQHVLGAPARRDLKPRAPGRAFLDHGEDGR
jgi:hypothetical protein